VHDRQTLAAHVSRVCDMRYARRAPALRTHAYIIVALLLIKETDDFPQARGLPDYVPRCKR